MTIKLTETDTEMTIEFMGEIDHHSAKKVLLQIDLYLQKKLPPKTTFDFSQVTFMDSSGIAIVLKGYKVTKEYDGIFHVINVPPQAYKVMKAAGLNRIINILTTEEVSV